MARSCISNAGPAGESSSCVGRTARPAKPCTSPRPIRSPASPSGLMDTGCFSRRPRVAVRLASRSPPMVARRVGTRPAQPRDRNGRTPHGQCQPRRDANRVHRRRPLREPWVLEHFQSRLPARAARSRGSPPVRIPTIVGCRARRARAARERTAHAQSARSQLAGRVTDARASGRRCAGDAARADAVRRRRRRPVGDARRLPPDRVAVRQLRASCRGARLRDRVAPRSCPCRRARPSLSTSG